MPKKKKTPPRGRFEFRLPAQTLELFRQAAALDKRTVSDWARVRLEEIAKEEVQNG